MRKRTADKILKQFAAGRAYPKGKLLAANDKLFGRGNRGMLSFMAWAPESRKNALEFARAIKRIDAWTALYKNATNAELSA